jgi:putative chitinase
MGGELVILTRQQFLAIMPNARVDKFLDPLNAAAAEFEINTPARQRQFLPQLAHESGEFRYMQEIANGSAYEGRIDLGNDEPGDGIKYKGHGPIQITGKKNHFLCADALGIPRDEICDYLVTPVGGCRGAAWFWRVGAGQNLSARAKAHGIPVGVDLNDLADAGDFMGITLAINGGTNGLADRRRYLALAETHLVEA